MSEVQGTTRTKSLMVNLTKASIYGWPQHGAYQQGHLNKATGHLTWHEGGTRDLFAVGFMSFVFPRARFFAFQVSLGVLPASLVKSPWVFQVYNCIFHKE